MCIGLPSFTKTKQNGRTNGRCRTFSGISDPVFHRVDTNVHQTFSCSRWLVPGAPSVNYKAARRVAAGLNLSRTSTCTYGFSDSHLLIGVVEAAEHPRQRQTKGSLAVIVRINMLVNQSAYAVDSRASLDWYILNVTGQWPHFFHRWWFVRGDPCGEASCTVLILNSCKMRWGRGQRVFASLLRGKWCWRRYGVALCPPWHPWLKR